MPDTEQLLSMTGEAAVLVQRGRATFANAEAREILGQDCVGKRVAALFGETISGVQASSFLAQVRLREQPYLVRIARHAAARVLGEEAYRSSQKVTGAEDFSVYMEHIPGVYGYLGIRNPEKGINCGNHHPCFLVDEDVLVKGAEIYVRFALDYLTETSGEG